MPSHLYLTGYRGTGKSSVGVLLARRLGRPICDLDQVIEANVGKTIAEIFQSGGEATFRELETEALQNVAQAPPAVVSLGGGAVLRDQNRQLVAATGICIWLDADSQTVSQRLQADSATAQRRPSLTPQGGLPEIETLLETRRPLYQEVSDRRIDTVGKSPEQVADEILEWLHGPGGDSTARHRLE